MMASSSSKPGSSRSTTGRAAAAVVTAAMTLVTSAAVVVFMVYRYRQNSHRDDDNDDGCCGGRSSLQQEAATTIQQHQEQQLPSHIQREIYKDRRRKASIRHLAMKKPMYDNIEMYDPDGVMLCTIGKKKANWYVNKKKLAIWKVPSKSIQLSFTPKSKKTVNEDDHSSHEQEEDQEQQHVLKSKSESSILYNTSHKKNICVACGVSDGLMRHYVVPYSYRRLLPTKFKSHLPHDVVLLCLDCHLVADHTGIQQREVVFERIYRTDADSARPTIPNPHLRHVKSCAQALWKHRQKLPVDRAVECEKVVMEYLSTLPDGEMEDVDDVSATTSTSTQEPQPQQEPQLSNEILEKLVLETLETTDFPNPKYVPISVLVTNSLKSDDDDVTQFIISWRQLFIDTLQPRYLPTGWSVDSNVENDG